MTAQGIGIDAGLAEDGLDTGVGVLQVGGGVAFKRQHQIPVEDVVGGAVLGEIRILDRAHGDGVHHLGLLFGREVAVAALQQGAGALFRFVQQVNQLDGAAGAGLVGTAVLAQHHAEGVVLEGHGLRHIARLAGDGPGLHQVLVLTGVDEVHDPVGAQVLVTVFGAGDVGGGVEETAVALLDDDAHGLAILVLELVQEDHGGPFALDCQPLGFQVGNDLRQHVVVHGLAHDVLVGQGDVQTVVVALVLLHGHVDQLLPHGAAVLIATLQFHHVVAGALGEGFVFVVVTLGLGVEGFQVLELHVGGVLVGHLLQIGDQHAELGAPVADVVGTHHLVAQEFEGAGGHVTEHGGADVVHRHLLGHVGGGVVHHHGLRRRQLHVGVVGGHHGFHLTGQPARVEEEVDEAGAGDLDLGDQIGGGQVLDDGSGQLAGILAGRFGQQHGQVGGQVAVSLLLASVYLHPGFQVGGQDACGLEIGYRLFK